METKFKCRLCGCDKYEYASSDGDVVVDVEDSHKYTDETGHTVRMQAVDLGYKCCGCSVMFQDPDKFSKKD